MKAWPALALLLPALVLGCGDKSDDDDDGGDDTATDDTGDDGGDDTGDDTGGGGGDPLADELEASTSASADCETVQGQAVAGATGFYLGVYRDQGGGTWTGEERWVLHANSAWTAAGGGDCVVRWTTTASEVTTGACSACDLGLQVSATVDVAGTTCPADLYEGDESWAVTYGVQRSGDTARFYFVGSSAEFAHGPTTDGVVSFLSAGACQWF